MFSGINEILLIAAIVLAVIFIPRVTAPRKAVRNLGPSQRKSGAGLSGRLRLSILASFCWAVFWAVYFEPWQGDWKLFVYIGAGPVLVAWGFWWALGGRRTR